MPPHATLARLFLMSTILGACSTPPHEGAAAVDPQLEAVTITRECPAGRRVSDTAIQTARGVAYSAPSGRPLRVDVAWSGAGAPAPLVLLLHGGSWSGGAPASLHAEMLALARLGYTAAAVEYRLTQAPRNVFPAAISDVRCALRTLRRRADEYHIDPARVAVMGYSAGGHLASLLGTGADVAGLDSACGDADGEPVRVHAVVSYAGPQDLRVNGPYTREQAEIVTNFLGVFPGDDPRVAALASPIVHVSAGDPPFLLIHGPEDDLVPVDHPRRMAAALRQVGTPATLLELPGVGHAFVGMAASSDRRVRCTVEQFLGRWAAGA